MLVVPVAGAGFGCPVGPGGGSAGERAGRLVEAAAHRPVDDVVADLDAEWLESKERRREWVDYTEAVRRLAWKAELAQGLSLSSLAPPPKR